MIGLIVQAVWMIVTAVMAFFMRRWRNEARAAATAERSLWNQASQERMAAAREKEEALLVLEQARAMYQEHAQ